MNWKAWKTGLLVSLLSGVFNGLIGLAIDLTWKQIGIMMLVSVGKDGLLWLKNHPIESVFDTSFNNKPKP
jgi:hypothetical protein